MQNFAISINTNCVRLLRGEVNTRSKNSVNRMGSTHAQPAVGCRKR